MILAISDTIAYAFDVVNIIPTILLGIVLLYWLTVILGALDLGFLDFDLDADYDADIEIEVDVDADFDSSTDVSSGVSGFAKVLYFLNMGKVPFMIFMSFLIIPLWFIMMSVNLYIQDPTNPSFLWSLLYLVPAIVVSAILAKIFTQPFANFFKKLEEDDMHDFDMVGKICDAKYSLSSEKISQAEVRYNGSVFLINAKVVRDKTIPRGQSGLVLEYRKEEKYYLVEPYQKSE